MADQNKSVSETDNYNTLKDEFNSVVTSSIGRGVAAGAALAIPVVTALCAWAQKKIGIKLDPASLTAFIVTMGTGIAVTAFRWLSNRGNWERTVVDAYQLYLTGQAVNPAKGDAAANQTQIPPPEQG